jgi:hypothetical protein
VALGTGIAVAAGVTLPFSGDGNTINGCYSSGGALKVLTPSEQRCLHRQWRCGRDPRRLELVHGDDLEPAGGQLRDLLNTDV